MCREKKRKEKAEKNDIFCENNIKRGKKEMEKEEMIQLIEELEDEMQAQPAWSAHESAIVYLRGLYEKTKETMKELQISTADLEKAAEAARKAESSGSDFETFKALDDAFFNAMERAYHLISEKI